MKTGAHVLAGSTNVRELLGFHRIYLAESTMRLEQQCADKDTAVATKIQLWRQRYSCGDIEQLKTHLKVIVTAVFADDHAFINFGTWSKKKHTAVLQ
jgi:hypothetical protein